jgi:hypothetical protein
MKIKKLNTVSQILESDKFVDVKSVKEKIVSKTEYLLPKRLIDQKSLLDDILRDAGFNLQSNHTQHNRKKLIDLISFCCLAGKRIDTYYYDVDGRHYFEFASILKSKFFSASRYPKVIDALIEHKIIKPLICEFDKDKEFFKGGSYSFGGIDVRGINRCKKYTLLVEEFAHASLNHFEIAGKYDSTYHLGGNRLKVADNISCLRINYKDNMEFIKQVYKEQIEKERKKTKKTDKQLPYYTEEDIIFEMENFNKNSHNPIADKFGRRVHSKLTRLPKKLRTLVYHVDRPNESLYELDIKNSQPQFMSEITPKWIEAMTKTTLSKKVCEKFDAIRNSESFKAFKKEAQDGQIYERMAEEFKVVTGVEKTRGEAKKAMFMCMFSDYNKRKSQENKIWLDIMKNKFSGFYDLMKLTKSLNLSNYRSENDQKNRYKNSAMLAQRIESEFIFNIVIQDLKHSVDFFATIHDSVIVFENDVQDLYDSFEKGLLKTGFNFAYTIEKF